MKILNNGIEQEVKILTYFKLTSDANLESEYVLYTNVEREGENIYIASVFHEDTKIKFVKPMPETLGILKKIIQNLISSNPNSFIFSQNKYQYIETKNLQNVEVVEYQRISLTPEQYKNMLNSKYLTYPYSNLTNIKKPEGFKGKYNAMADTLSIVVSSVLILLIIGGLAAYHFNWNYLKAGIFDIDGILSILLNFNFHINNYLLLQISILVLLFSLISFNTEKTRPISFWMGTFLILMIVYILYFAAKTNWKFDGGFNVYIKYVTIYSIFAAIIISLTYSVCKELTSLITNKLSFCNFITHYLIFYILFTISFLGVGLFYYNYLYEHVSEFTTKLVVKSEYVVDDSAKMSAARSSAYGYIDSIEYYSGYVQVNDTGKIRVEGFDVSIPKSNSGNVICKTNNGTSWSGEVATNSSTCTEFMNAVLTKSKSNMPQAAKIILNENGKVQSNSYIKYNGYYCIYDGTSISEVTKNEP